MFKVFTWDRILIYGGILLATLLLSSYMIFILPSPIHSKIVIGTLFLSVSLIIFRYFYTRYKFKKSIVYTTALGINIRQYKSNSSMAPGLSKIVDDTNRCFNWWANRYPATAKKFRKYINGFIVTVYHDEELVINGKDKNARGILQGTSIIALKTKDTDWDNVANIIGHELSHAFLFVLGDGFKTNEEQHKTMKYIKCPWA